MSLQATCRPLTPADFPAISQLHAKVFGPGRFARTAYRVREDGGNVLTPYCSLAQVGEKLIAAVRFTPITIGGDGGALLLGPLAVDPDYANRGFGRRLVGEAIAEAQADGIALVALVGDEPYYGRFGFRPVPSGQITLPGPVDPRRLLTAELVSGALSRYRGRIEAQREA